MEKKKKFDYSYVIVAICAIMIFVGLGFCSSSKKSFLNPILEYNSHISKGLYGFSDTFRFATTAIVNIFFSALIVKFGVKKLIGAGFLSLTLSMVLYALSTHVIGFYLAGAFLGLGLSWSTTTMVGYLINKWCNKNRGTILGITLATNGLGGALATFIFSPIANATPKGYKFVYLIFALIVAIIGITAVILVKDKPLSNSDHVLEKKKQRGSDWVGIDTKTAYKKPYFYLFLGTVFFTGLALPSITTIDAMHMKIIGVPFEIYNPMVGAGMFILTFSKFLTGFLYDRLGLRTTITISYLAAIISITTLIFINATSSPFVCGLYFVLVDVALPLETILLPIFASDLFGKKDYSKFLGLVISINTLGQALGSPFTLYCYELFKSYTISFYISLSVMIISLLVLQYVISASNKERKKIEQEMLSNNA